MQGETQGCCLYVQLFSFPFTKYRRVLIFVGRVPQITLTSTTQTNSRYTICGERRRFKSSGKRFRQLRVPVDANPLSQSQRDERILRPRYRQPFCSIRRTSHSRKVTRQFLSRRRKSRTRWSPERLYHFLPSSRCFTAFNPDLRDLVQWWKGET